MPVCPSCLRPLDDAAQQAGRCSACGGSVRPLPQRTIADGGCSSKATHAGFGGDATIELPAPGAPTGSIDLQTLGSLEAHDAGAEQGASVKPATVAIHGQQTVEFLGGSAAIDENLLTSHWESLAAGARHAGVTLKQKETITGSFVGSSSLVVKSRNVRASGGSPQPLITPADAPDYELLDVIGEGGMGVVYAARQSSIARTVALKMLKGPDGKSPAQRDKFISEAVVTGELDHPNIVPIYDLGADSDGALFYSMKRVKGTPWHKALATKSLDENLNILLRVADAVAFAHANGVIHRDLKPENVMLGDFGEVLVMDWGLARVSADFPNAASVSQSEAMGGTPAYMAPEMATGPIEKITPASDVYLLGAMLYEIVAGKPPHAGKTVMACLFAAAKNLIEPTAATGELLDVALKAMATNPADRYPSVAAFQRAVRQYQSHSQSIALTEHAERNAQLAQSREDYDLYARALYGLEEALALWPDNRRAAELLDASRLSYARLALAKADFDLGASLLVANNPAHRPLLDELIAGQRERQSRQRRIALLKRAVAALVLAVICVVSVAYAAVRVERDEAVSQRQRAEAEKQRAIDAEGRALQNFRAAEAARVTAVAAEKKAQENFQEAANQRDRAEQEKQRAETQRRLAVEARQAEAYAAYVARIGLAKAKIDENSFDQAMELLAQCPPELRHWEWGRLDYLCRLSDRTWKSSAPIDAAVLSPDGSHFATGDWDGKATIWNLHAGGPVRQFSHGQYVHAVAYDATGERLATGSSDGSVHVYRALDGELVAKLDGHADAVLSVRFSPDGRLLASGGCDNTARLWDLAAAKTVQVLRGHAWWVWSAEFSPDGKLLVTASQDGKAVVWRRTSPPAAAASDGAPAARNLFERATEFVEHRGPVYAARFAPDGRLIATAGADGRVLVWNPTDARPVDVGRRLDGLKDAPVPFTELTGHRGPVRTLAFAPDGRTLASGGQDNLVFVWDHAAGKPLKQLRGHASYVRSCSYSADGALVLTAGRDAQVKLWRPDRYAEVRELAAGETAAADAVLAARFSADGTRVVTASRDWTASLWDAASLERVQWFREGHDFLASSAAFFADGARLATAAGDRTVRIWDVKRGAEMQRLEGTGRTSALDASDDGRLIATGGEGGEAIVWDAASGAKLAVLLGHPAEVTAACFAPGGGLLATGDDRGQCRLWRFDADAGRWSAGAVLSGHSRTITRLQFTGDGARLVSSSGDNTCGQWDVAAGRELTSLVLKHPDWVADVVVSRDGAHALTGCDDGQLRLWSLAEARVVRTIKPQNSSAALTSIALSADGRLAAAACAAEGTVRLWDLAAGEEIAPDDETGRPRAWLDRSARGGLVWLARFAPQDDRLLVVGGNDARLYDIVSRQQVVRFSPHGVVASADVSPDGSRVVTGSWDRSAKIWDAATGKVLVKLDGLHSGFINSVAFSPDGRQVLTASDDGTARLWDASDGRPLEPVFRHDRGRLRYAGFSPDGARILTAGDDKTARIADARTGAVLHTLAGHEWAVRSAAFSADGRYVITGSEDNLALVWDAATGAKLQTLAGHTGAINSVALSPDGGRALTASADGAVKAWDARTGKELLTLAAHSDEATSASFAPDGRTVLTSGRDGRVLLWPAEPWHAPAAAGEP
ncbi:MAG: serine/threonine protein kinase [Planctomycetota bacterium]|nr:MAG: serine/threonine protein kinase [Planctomycetota bacterium]